MVIVVLRYNKIVQIVKRRHVVLKLNQILIVFIIIINVSKLINQRQIKIVNIYQVKHLKAAKNIVHIVALILKKINAYKY